jgi:hypothetical protein
LQKIFSLGNFSFLQSDAYNILCLAHSLVPGIAKVMSVSNNADKGSLEILYIDHPSPNRKPEVVFPNESVLDALKSMSQGTEPTSWYSDDDLPFNIEKEKIVQMDAFKELEKNILMISVPGDQRKSNDLFFFYFNQNISNFTISPSDKSLNQQNKLIIGSLIYHAVTTLISNLRNDRRAMDTYNIYVNNVVNEMTTAQTAIEHIREKNDSVKLNYANEAILELSHSYSNISFELSQSAEKKIKEFDGDMTLLKQALDNAMSNARTYNNNIKNQSIIIEGFQLNFNMIRTDEQKPVIITPASRKEKTILLLDKLEEAAAKVKDLNKPLTAANIREVYYKKISAPGITDALKNHGKTIRDLMEEHPEKWPTIRKDFKPLINILNNRFPVENRKSDQA